MSTWTVGQEVIVRRPIHRGPAEDAAETISRVGRKYVYIAGRFGREDAYDAETGIQKDGGNYARRIYEPEALAELDRRAAALNSLREALRDPGWHRALDVDDMRAIVAIIDAANLDAPAAE